MCLTIDVTNISFVARHEETSYVFHRVYTMATRFVIYLVIKDPTSFGHFVYLAFRLTYVPGRGVS